VMHMLINEFNSHTKASFQMLASNKGDFMHC